MGLQGIAGNCARVTHQSLTNHSPLTGPRSACIAPFRGIMKVRQSHSAAHLERLFWCAKTPRRVMTCEAFGVRPPHQVKVQNERRVFVYSPQRSAAWDCGVSGGRLYYSRFRRGCKGHPCAGSVSCQCYVAGGQRQLPVSCAGGSVSCGPFPRRRLATWTAPAVHKS